MTIRAHLIARLSLLACLLAGPAAARGDLSLTLSGAEVREQYPMGLARSATLFSMGARLETRTDFVRSGAHAEVGYFRRRPAWSGGLDVAVYRAFLSQRLELAAGPGIAYDGLARNTVTGAGSSQAAYVHRYSPFFSVGARLLSGLHSGVDVLIGSDVAWRARVGYTVFAFD